MHCFLGFDGGGTKTDCVLTDEFGKILARSRSGPSNPFRIGVEVAARSVLQAADQALLAAGAHSADVKAICAGLAGTARAENSEKMRTALLSAFPHAAVRVMTDLELALDNMNPGPAIVLVAGTGSAAIGRDTSGKTARVGGLGPRDSDEGSAFDVGRGAIAASVQHRKLHTEESSLGRQILGQLGCENWAAVSEKARTDADAVFPRVFPVVVAAADAEDSVARELLSDAAGKLALLVKNLAQALKLENQSFALGKTGGMMGRSAFFDAALDQHLLEASPAAKISLLPLSPVDAAARLARELARTVAGSDS